MSGSASVEPDLADDGITEANAGATTSAIAWSGLTSSFTLTGLPGRQ
jgi:hypothetical protein